MSISKKKVFMIENYNDRKVSMRCRTLKEAIAFLDFLHQNGRTWCDNSPYTEFNNFDNYGENTCYYFNEGTYGNYRTAKDEGLTVLEYREFDWSEDAFVFKISKEEEASFDSFINGFKINH